MKKLILSGKAKKTGVSGLFECYLGVVATGEILTNIDRRIALALAFKRYRVGLAIARTSTGSFDTHYCFIALAAIFYVGEKNCVG